MIKPYSYLYNTITGTLTYIGNRSQNHLIAYPICLQYITLEEALIISDLKRITKFTVI